MNGALSLRMPTRLFACALALALCTGARARADELPVQLKNVDVVEHLGDKLPGELVFTDSTGKRAPLSARLQSGKPVVLTLVYYECPMLCSLVLTGLVKTIKAAELKLGQDFEAVTVSFNPAETPSLAAERQRGYLQSLGAGTPQDWTFHVGDEPEIRALTDAVGFKYSYDPNTKQFAHAAVSVVLTPDGKISRYLYGIDYPARDLKLAVLEAGQGRVGTTFERLILSCFQYDPAKRTYGFYISAYLKTGGLLVFAALGLMLARLWRREIKQGTVA